MDKITPKKILTNLNLKVFLKNRSFILFMFSGFFLYLVNQFYMLAQVSKVLKLTNSTVFLGTILMVMAIPRLVILPIGGLLVDRFSEKYIMAFGFGVLTILLTTLGILEVLNQLTLVWLIIFAALFGVSTAIILPATYSIVPKLVREQNLQKANALVQFISQLTVFIGPAIAGLFLGILEISVYFFIMVGLVLLSLGLIFKTNIHTEIIQIKPNEDNAKPKGGSKKELSKGFKVIFSNPVIVLLMLFTAILNIGVIGPQQVGLPILANTYLKIGTNGLGYLLSTFGLGSLIGALIGGLFSKRNTFSIMILSAILFGVIWAFFTWFNSFWVVMSLLCIAGLLVGFINVLFITILQISSPPNLLGRVMSLQFMSSTGLQPISYLITGLMISSINLRITYLLAGLIIVVFSFSILIIYRILTNKSIDKDVKNRLNLIQEEN